MVADTGKTGVYVAAAEFFSGNDFACSSADQWRSSKKDRALIADDYVLVAHRGDVSATGGTGAHHNGDLGNGSGGHPGHVVKDAAEVVAVGKDFGLQREESAPGIDQINAG